MESAHSHHHLQDQQLGSSASSFATPPFYGVPNWPPTSFLNTNGFTSSYPNLNSRQQDNDLLPSHFSSMSPDLTFNWPHTPAENYTTDQDLQYSRIKEELADLYYRKYTAITDADDEGRSLQQNDHRTRLLLKSFSSGDLMNKIQLSPADLYSDSIGVAGRGFCQIFPSLNVSSLNQTGLANARALDMNLEAVDLLASSRFGGSNFVASAHDQAGILRDGFSFGFDHMQQSLEVPFYGSSKVSPSSNAAAAEAKRSCNKMEPKAQFQNAPKKSRLEARSSCPPFKVRKEKLGDRIAALQQLVAPFGKTDTASVLMEAIGYIKFLQSQVETLSVPYMKASRNRVTKGGPAEHENEERKRDLKSRGLCLVPLSCLSYITDGGGGAVWPPPHFDGAT